jgi:hypothetical protein
MLLAWYWSGDTVKEAKMAEAYGRCGVEEKCIQDIGGES